MVGFHIVLNVVYIKQKNVLLYMVHHNPLYLPVFLIKVGIQLLVCDYGYDIQTLEQKSKSLYDSPYEVIISKLNFTSAYE